jgi:hypothetical protein
MPQPKSACFAVFAWAGDLDRRRRAPRNVDETQRRAAAEQRVAFPPQRKRAGSVCIAGFVSHS